MSIPVQIRLKCPCCGQEFEDEYNALISVNGGGIYPDFQSGFAVAHKLSEMLLYSCDNCGFTERNVLEWFERPLSPELREFVNKECKRQYQDRAPAKDAVPGKFTKYERYARIQKFLKANPLDIAISYLRASWTNEEQLNKHNALFWFEKALDQTDCVSVVEAPFVAYLAGETSRLVNEPEDAAKYYALARRTAGQQPALELIRQMIDKQTSDPIYSPQWAYQQMVLDPLSHFHAYLLLTTAGEMLKMAPQNALKLYRRAFDLCQATLERYVSPRIPYLPAAADSDALRSSFASMYMKDPRGGGIWVDHSLIQLGRMALAGWYQLRFAAESAEETDYIDQTYRRFHTQLELIDAEKELKEKQTTSQAGSPTSSTAPAASAPVARVLSTVFFIIILSILSSLASTLTLLIYKLFNQSLPYWRLVGSLTVSVVAGMAFSTILRWILQRLSSAEQSEQRKALSNGISGLLGALGGFALLFFLSSWPGIVSTLILSFLLLILSRLIKR